MNELKNSLKSCNTLINQRYRNYSNKRLNSDSNRPVATMVERFVESLAHANDSGSFDTSLEVKSIHPQRKRSKCITELDRDDILKFVRELESRKPAIKQITEEEDAYIEYAASDSDFESTDQEFFDTDDFNDRHQQPQSETTDHQIARMPPVVNDNYLHPYVLTEEYIEQRLTLKTRCQDSKNCRAARLLNFLSSARKTMKNLKSSSCSSSRNASPIASRSSRFAHRYHHLQNNNNSDTEDDGISTGSHLASHSISPDSSFEFHPPIVPTFKVTPHRDHNAFSSFGQMVRNSFRAKRASVLRRSISNPDNYKPEDILNEGSKSSKKTDFVEAKTSIVRRALGAAMIRNLDVLCGSQRLSGFKQIN